MVWLRELDEAVSACLETSEEAQQCSPSLAPAPGVRQERSKGSPCEWHFEKWTKGPGDRFAVGVKGRDGPGDLPGAQTRVPGGCGGHR